jgi:hypothetical protein
MVWGADLTAKASAEPYQPVWVDLGIVFGATPADTAPPSGDPTRLLVLTGRVVGRLRAWCRAADGRWIGLVDFTIYDQNGRAVVFNNRTAVPASALTPIPPTPQR